MPTSADPVAESAPTQARAYGFGRFITRVLVPAFLIAVTVFFGRAFGYAIYLSYFSKPVEVTVPNVTGLGVQQAQLALERAGLLLEVDETRHQEKVPRNRVTAQDPAPGQLVRRKRKVAVEVSLGPEELPVPRLMGLSLPDARRALENAHLTLGKVTITTKRQGENEGVVSQAPRAGRTVKRGSPVQLTIQTGNAARVSVPRIEGESFEKARAALSEANLAVGSVQWVLHEQYDAGTVIRQTPAAGAAAQPGSGVDCLVSAGNDYRQHSLRQRTITVRALDIFGPQEFHVSVKDPTGSYVVYEGTHYVGEKIVLQVTGVNGGEYEVVINEKMVEHGRI